MNVGQADHASTLPLVNLLRALLRWWWVVALSAILCTASAIGISYLMPIIYRAEVLLQPADEEATSQLSGLAAQFGITAGGGTSAAEAQAVLESKTFAINFIRSYNLLPILFAKRWDPVRERWTVEDPKKIPTELDGYRLFRDSVREVSRDRQTGHVLLAIEWTDPRQAAAWANTMVTMLNDVARRRAAREARESMGYLRVAYQRATVAELRESIVELMSREMNKAMLANVREEYAFRVLDPAVVPNRRIRPNRVLLAAAGLAIGLALGVIAALVLDSRRQVAR